MKLIHVFNLNVIYSVCKKYEMDLIFQELIQLKNWYSVLKSKPIYLLITVHKFLEY